jgi:Transposase and inactivated derivatives, IS1 family
MGISFSFVFQLSLMQCKYCNAICVKKGVYKSKQLFQCSSCKKYQRNLYSYKKTSEEDLKQIVVLNNEGLGIRSIGRVLHVSPATIQRKIFQIANGIVKPIIYETQQEYEVDELCTFIKSNKPCNYVYIAYAINKRTKRVIDFVIGQRSKEILRPFIDKLLALSPKKIFTDKLNTYTSLIPASVHRCYEYCTNRIERFNLTLRTHLKRLTRKTLCYSKSLGMLQSCIKLYIQVGSS